MYLIESKANDRINSESIVETVDNQIFDAVECFNFVSTVSDQGDGHILGDTEGQDTEEGLCIDTSVFLSTQIELL